MEISFYLISKRREKEDSGKTALLQPQAAITKLCGKRHWTPGKEHCLQEPGRGKAEADPAS